MNIIQYAFAKCFLNTYTSLKLPFNRTFPTTPTKYENFFHFFVLFMNYWAVKHILFDCDNGASSHSKRILFFAMK